MDHLWAPWRSTYVQGASKPDRCVFCEVAQSSSDEENFVLHRGELCFAMLNRFPYTSGHLMIAPYAHVSRLQQASEAATAEMMQLTRQAERALEEAYRPNGLNLGMNLGEAAGAGIEHHIHMHVLPRWNGDTNFMTATCETRVLSELLADGYRKLNGKF